MKGNKWQRLSFQDRFWMKVDIGSEDECWPWLAGTNDRGDYGRFQVYNRFVDFAHRVAYELENGIELGLLEALHSCDFGLCCNPKHLFSGTQAANMADMVSKGRQKTGNQYT